MMRVKTIWNASGNRHAMLPERKENPNVSQLESEKPEIQFACRQLVERVTKKDAGYRTIWIIMSFPLLRILLVSACHTPAVAVFIPSIEKMSANLNPEFDVVRGEWRIPVPSPATTLPTIICATLNEAVCITAPTAITVLPIIT